MVKLLILNRSKLDKSYELAIYSNEDEIHESSGTPVLHEEIVCTYIDLDRLIGTCGLSTQQLFVVTEAMKGYAMADIAQEFEIARHSVDGALRTAIEKMVSRNDELWNNTMRGRCSTAVEAKESAL